MLVPVLVCTRACVRVNSVCSMRHGSLTAGHHAHRDRTRSSMTRSKDADVGRLASQTCPKGGCTPVPEIRAKEKSPRFVAGKHRWNVTRTFSAVSIEQLHILLIVFYSEVGANVLRDLILERILRFRVVEDPERTR